MELNFENRRKHVRRSLNVTSLCLKRDEGVNKLEMDVTPIRNIGLGGAFLQTDSPYQKNTCIDIQFILPEISKPITIRGKVAWTNIEGAVPGMGVEFISMSERDKNALAQYLQDLQ
jgi:uncharacterized protein (TIGR02266 family)